jgi:DNA-binding response OmpR family regulator
MPKHIVVIDDCMVTLSIVSDFLASAGYRVSTAESCVYSNHLIYSSSPPDLILLDLMMPFMSGDKKTRLLKERLKSRNIPIILISSKDESELSVIAANAGADGYLAKPFSATELVRTVKSYLAA